LLEYNCPSYSKLYIIGVIDDVKRRLDWVRSHLWQLWKNNPEALSSSFYVANEGKVINQLISVKMLREANDNWPLQLVPFRVPGSSPTEARLGRKAQKALKNLTRLTRRDFIQSHPALCLPGVLAAGRELRAKAVDSMVKALEIDCNIPIDTDQNAPDGSACSHCPSD
jgi:hypothetical protein